MLAELVAAGCGDWDRLERTWTLHRYAALQRHWTAVAPPAHIVLAAWLGFKPKRGGGEVADDPEQLMRRLRAMGALG